MPILVPDDCAALLFCCLLVFFPQTGKPGGQIRLTAITGVQRRGGFSEPSAIFAPVLLLSVPQLEKIFYCTCTSYLPVTYPASPQNNEVAKQPAIL